MKTESLLKALNLAKPALGGNDATSPILSHFVFLEDMLYAFNDTVAIIVEEETGLTCALHGDTLLGLLQAGAAEDFDIKMEKGTARLKMKRGWAELPSLDPELSQFQIPDEEPRATLPIFVKGFLPGLQQVMLSVGLDSIKPEYFGVTLSMSKAEGIVLYSTDNKSASRVQLPKGIVKHELAVVLPPQACALMLKLAEGGADEGLISFGSRTATVTFGGVTLVTRIADAAVESFRKIFDVHSKAPLTELDEQFKTDIQRAAVLLSRDAIKECVITNEGGKLNIRAEGTLGRMVATLPGRKGSQAYSCVDPELVLRVLDSVESWGINDSRSFLLVGELPGKFTHIINSRAAPEAPKKEHPRNTAPDDIPF